MLYRGDMHVRSILVVVAALVAGVFVACGGSVEVDRGDGGTKPCDGCLAVPTATQLSCTATTSTVGCRGIPADPWGGAGTKPSATDSVYPPGCRVTFPHENPYYPGSPQTCDCQTISPTMPPQWVCPL
jgi:hypothetical protein